MYNWQPPLRSLDGYKHVVDVDYCPPVSSKSPQFPPEAAKAKGAAQISPSTQNTVEYHEIVEGNQNVAIIDQCRLFYSLIQVFNYK